MRRVRRGRAWRFGGWLTSLRSRRRFAPQLRDQRRWVDEGASSVCFAVVPAEQTQDFRETNAGEFERLAKASRLFVVRSAVCGLSV